MKKDDLYNEIMEAVSKIVKKWLDDALCVVNVKDLDDFAFRCYEYCIHNDYKGKFDSIKTSLFAPFYNDIYVLDQYTPRMYDTPKDVASDYNDHQTQVINEVQLTIK